MSPEVKRKNKNKKPVTAGLRPFMTAAVLLVFLLLSAVPALAWTGFPDDVYSGMTAEQKTLAESVPEAHRALTIAYLTGGDAVSLLKRYSPYAYLISQEGLTSTMRVANYLTGSRHADFTTEEGQQQKQFLLELYMAVSDRYASYSDPVANKDVYVYYSEELHKLTLEKLQKMRTDLDSERINFAWQKEQQPQWKALLDSWIAYRGGSVEAQAVNVDRAVAKSYANGAYPQLEEGLQQLMDDMPDVYKLLTYASLTGTDGLSWLRENSKLSINTIAKYWGMDLNDLSEAYIAFAAGGKESSDEAVFLLQLYALRAKTYPLYNAGTWGIDYRDNIRMQDLARGAEAYLSYETVRSYLADNSASQFWVPGCDTEIACRAWMDYFKRLAPESLAAAEKRREEAAAREAALAGLDWKSMQETSESYRKNNGRYQTPAVSSLPAGAELDDALNTLFKNIPGRYVPQIYYYFNPNLGADGVIRACVKPEYKAEAEELLKLSVSGLENEYIRIGQAAALGDLSREEAARLELCAQILLCRYAESGKGSFGYLSFNYNNKKKAWETAYYNVNDYDLYSYSDPSLILKTAKAGDQDLLYIEQQVQLFSALEEYIENMKVDPLTEANRSLRSGKGGMTQELLDAARRIGNAALPDMRVYALAIATRLIEPDSDLAYAEMPEQLWARRGSGSYGRMTPDNFNKLMSYYGTPAYRVTSYESFYTASDAVLKDVVSSVNQYTDEAKAEAQRILWHRAAEFYSVNGNYHARLARMSLNELRSYGNEIETAYFAASDPDKIAELKQWVEQINAWTEWRTALDPASGFSGGTGTPGNDGPGSSPGTGYTDGSHAGGEGSVPYVLELSTGLVSGGNIEFFRIVYETGSGDIRTQYLFPSEDSLLEGFRAAEAAGTPKRVLDWVSTYAGYKTEDPGSADALRSFHTDQFLFNADEEIKTVSEIQAFMRRDDSTGGKNEWTCTGLRLYRVDKLQGLARYGYYSSEAYIDFDGTLLAELIFDSESYQNLSWRNSDTLFRFGGSKGESGYSLGLSSGDRRIQSTSPNVIFRVDFADQYMAGIESLATDYQGSNTKALARPGNICEALSLTVRYRDIFGSVRDVTLPMITSTASWSVLDGRISGIQDYAGLAQQGESIGFEAVLPDLAEVLYVSPILGGDAAASAAGLKADSGMSAASYRDSRIASSNSETASILCIAVYDAEKGRLSADYEDYFLRFRYPSMPSRFYRANDITGLRLDAGGAASMLEMEEYTASSQLLPRELQDRYLLTFVTDDVDLAGTRSDLMVRLGYIDLDDNERQTAEYMVRDYAGDFYGYWPGSADDFGYIYGLSSDSSGGAAEGRSLSVLIPLQDVQKFTSVTVRLAGANGRPIDEWQFKDLTIHTVDSVGKRSLKWQSVSVPGKAADGGSAVSDRVFTRNVSGNLIYDLAMGGAVDPDSPVLPTDPSFDPRLIDDGDPVDIDVNTPNVAERKDVNWRSLRYNMTFTDAMQDLGFLKPRATYTVQVKVASNVNQLSGEDDCGSRNQFYFQLLFAQGGKSAVVLANQQLQSDGFHAGSTETFNITTSQEYGDLSGVRIIAEDLASDSDKYDKLNIESITVIQQSDGQISPLWRLQDVGWIGIDYRDEGQQTSMSGVTSRTMEEVSHVYSVSESSYAVNVQFALSTGQYKDRKGEATEQFQGELSAEVTFRDVNGMIQRLNVEDVVALMYEYNNRPAKYTTVQSNGVFQNGQAVSDPDYMFRANHTDRFIIPLDGLEQLLNIKLYPRSSVNCVWNITDVNASLVQGSGRRILNVAGEYTMKYAEGQKLQLIARSNSTGEPKYSKQLYMSAESGGTSSPITVNFSSDKVRTDTSLFTAQAVVTEVPTGGNDTFNFVMYPTGNGANNINDYDLTVNIRYTTARDTIVQNSARMRKTTVDGEPVFYLEGLTADDLMQLNSVSVKSSSSSMSGISGGYAQRVRGGFILETYELGGMLNIERGMEVPFSVSEVEQQKLRFQIGEQMQEVKLKNGGNDVAVSVHYRPEGPSDREYQSRRYFLSSEGIDSLRPGQIIELNLSEGHVAEITGISFIPTGQVNLDIDDAYIVTSRMNAGGVLAQTGRFSFADTGADAGSGLIRRNVTASGSGEPGSVLPLYMDFVTGSRQDNAGAGISSPVGMTVGYYNNQGLLVERSYSDIRPFIKNDTHSFPADEACTAELLMEGARDVRWVDLTVLPDGGDQISIWNLSSLTIRLGENGQQLKREVTESIPEGQTRHLSFANVYISADLSYPLDRENDRDTDTLPTSQRISGGNVGLLIDSGKGIRIRPTVTGSPEGFRAELFSLDPIVGATGTAVLEQTHGYSEAYLNDLYEEARSVSRSYSSTDEEDGAAEALMNFITELRESSGSFDVDNSGITLFVPRNYSGSNLYYRVQVSSAETGDTAFTVDITVPSEANRLTDLVNTLRTAQNNALLQKLSSEVSSSTGGGL